MTYTDDVNDNNEFFGKVRNQLPACQPIGRDIMVLTDWMAARMIGLGWVQKLDHAKMPNVSQTCCQRCSAEPGTRTATTPSRGSPASPASPTTRR